MLRDDAEFLIKWMHYVQLFWEHFFFYVNYIFVWRNETKEVSTRNLPGNRSNISYEVKLIEPVIEYNRI